MSYGRFIYGTLKYGEQAIGMDVPVADIDLLRYLPPYWHTVREMIQLQKVAGQEVGQLKGDTDDLSAQIFVETATWGLELWERELGLTTNPEQPDDARREQIKAKLRGSGTSTVFLIQSVAEAFSGGEVEVIEKPGKYHFIVKFVGVKGIPPNMLGLSNAINDIKPAHLSYDWEYTWTWWALLPELDLTWDNAGLRSWQALRTYDERSRDD